MSSRHLFQSPEGLVVKALRGAISYNPSLSLIEDSKVVYDTEHDPNTVSIVSGGGAGHEPAWAGYVGKNMLAAGVSGDIFASPSTKQILVGLQAVPSNVGQILVITNYTGDVLHFGLAAEKVNAANKQSRCGVINCGDDVSVGKKGSLVGRRGLASQIGVLKILGAAAAGGASFDTCMALGKAVAEQAVSLAVTLDHCHVPGRTEHATLKENEIELGTGPHNEPGYKKISPVPSASDFMKTILKYILDEKDPERGYVHFEDGDQTILMISNFGGMSQLELGAVTDETLSQLESDWKIVPVRVYCGYLETSLNAPAFSTSVVNLTAAAKNCDVSVDQMLSYLDVRTGTQWESMAGIQAKRRPRKEQFVAAPKEEERVIDPKTDIKVDPTRLTKMLKSACNALITAEPDLTRWDTVMGDGDCGETLKTGATALLSNVDSLAESGSVIKVLHEVESIVESKMGGTLGGILGIFFVALTSGLQRNASETHAKPEQLWAKALSHALSNLQQATPAKTGDRTVMDVLIPFVESLKATENFSDAVESAQKAAESTKQMVPKLGRATYVGHAEGTEMPPDPGAWGAMEAIKGLYDGSKS